MKNKTSIKLPLTGTEKASLKRNKVKMADVPGYTPDELEVLLGADADRVKELVALAEFQTVPSVGIKFAEDLVFMGYYSLSALKGENGVTLTNAYEKKKGCWIDPCVEDQFRLVVDFANTGDVSKSWWNFTAERKKYRFENGYPSDRPQLAWHETPEYKSQAGK